MRLPSEPSPLAWRRCPPDNSIAARPSPGFLNPAGARPAAAPYPSLGIRSSADCSAVTCLPCVGKRCGEELQGRVTGSGNTREGDAGRACVHREFGAAPRGHLHRPGAHTPPSRSTARSTPSRTAQPVERRTAAPRVRRAKYDTQRVHACSPTVGVQSFDRYPISRGGGGGRGWFELPGCCNL